MLVKLLMAERATFTVVGDDDQCVYQFRGAEPGNFTRLPGSFQARSLVDNYPYSYPDPYPYR